MERQLASYEHRQICSLEEIRFWAYHGYGTQANKADRENPEEFSRRINRIGTVLQLLEEKENFHIALVGKHDEHLFGWDTNTNKTTVSWMVKDSGSPRVGIESKYHLPDGRWRKARMLIYEPCVDDAFKDTFKYLWDKLSSASTRKPDVIEALRKLQREVEERERRRS